MPKKPPKPVLTPAEAALTRSKQRIEATIRRLDEEIDRMDKLRAERNEKLEQLSGIDRALAMLKES